MRHSKQKRFIYWQARFTTEPNKETLQQLLHSAFAGTKVRQRLWSADEEENYQYFINHQSKRSDFFCANFFGYEKGKIDHVIKEAFEKSQIGTVPYSLSPNVQYLDGKLYFVCSGNHVILSQDTRLKAKRLEHYLNEMFHKRCDSFSENQQLRLERSISRKVRKKIKGVKKIHFSAPLKHKSQETSKHREQQTKNFLRSVWETAKSVVKPFIREDIDDIASRTGEFIDPKDIEVTLSLLWEKKKGERISDQLDSLTSTFRHVDEIDFEVETNSGMLKHEELRLQHESNVEHINDMPILTDIFGKMIDWYQHLVEAGDI